MAAQSFRLLLSIPREHPNASLFSDPAALRSEMQKWVRGLPGDERSALAPILAPDWTLVGREGRIFPKLSRSVVFEEQVAAIRIDIPPGIKWDVDDIQRYAEIVRKTTGIVCQGDGLLQSASWAPGDAFGTRAQARELIGLHPFQATQPTGRVNVVIVDQGFDGSAFPTRFAGGFAVGSRLPGKGRSRHAMMIARTVHDLAPDARLYDCPLIPTPPPGVPASLRDITASTLDAATLIFKIGAILRLHRKHGHATGSWVFVNSWAIYDRTSDVSDVRYCTDRQHVLNRAIAALVNDHGADVVFAAGNCGQFEPDGRCGHGDCGPDRSILGANSLSEVVTASAVRVDRTWLGYSSQGRGQPSLGLHKPDLCAPSQFADDTDANRVSTGTSSAAAVVGGAIAVLRGRWDQSAVSPAAMKQALWASATAPNPAGVARRTGAGIVNVSGAAKVLAGGAV
ncbi:MAG: S8 family serine peptidase [Gemmatimonadaceae bacterium]|nr:S8 family serine peptidase [Acetobacteraceae bacterium]